MSQVRHPATDETRVTHTPGPWKIDRYHPSRNPFGISQDRGAESKGVITSGGFARKSTDEAEANARLIAAAPELLEALEELAEIVQGALDDTNLHGLGMDSFTLQPARDAIKKARGQ